MIGRLNLFWAGAGGFLSLFCLNEILAYHLSRTPKWLGGPLVYGAMVVGLVLGLSVMAFLGVEAPREAQEEEVCGEVDDESKGEKEGRETGEAG
ncbi:MAG: hypothetical protein RMJ98_13400 [Myxococcales bacterium]|nr:hypothetical protein [Myxococcales bacterium]